jgi:transcriptional regulator with XRE-family HTH domain
MPIHAPDHDPMDFASRLKEALDDVGQNSGHGAGSDLARRFRVSAVSANAWLNGTNMPTPERARQLAAYLGVRFEWLYFGQLPKRGIADASSVYDGDLGLTPHELDVVRKYRVAPKTMQSIVDDVLDAATGGDKKKPRTPKG